MATNRWLTVAVVALGVLTIALAGALVVAAATDGDDPAPASASAAYSGCGMTWSMMAGPGNWDPKSMRAYMQNTLGDEGYDAMVAHMRAHLDGTDRDGAGFDQRWHAMMDGMMRGWSRADWDRCWGWMMQ